MDDPVRFLTDDLMTAMENDMTYDGDVVSNELIFTKKDGSTINTGNVKGPTGDQGSSAPIFYSAKQTEQYFVYANSSVWTVVTGWVFVEGTSSLVTIQQATTGGKEDEWFLVNQTGLYLANFSFTYDNSYDTAPVLHRQFVAFFVNGAQNTAYQNYGPSSSNSSYATVQVCCALDLVAGQKLSCRIYQDSGFITQHQPSPYSKMNLLKIG